MRARFARGRLGRVLPLATFGLALLLAPAAASAQVEGLGRVTIGPGWRLTPNDHFAAAAQLAGTPLEHASPGGPTLTGSFGYSPLDWLEIGIDLFVGAEQLQLSGLPTLTSITYGGAFGVRLQAPLGSFLFAQKVVPFAGVLTGPTLIDVMGAGLPGTEEALRAGYLVSAGVSFHLDDRWGFTLEYRLLLARGTVGTIGSINGGGSWVGVGVTYLLPAERNPNQDSVFH